MKKRVPELTNRLQTLLKDENSGRICNFHYTQIYQLKQKENSSGVESKNVNPQKFEIGNESESEIRSESEHEDKRKSEDEKQIGILTREMNAKSNSEDNKRKRGPPITTPLQDRVKIASIIANNNVSISQAGEVIATIRSNFNEESLNMNSRETSTRCLQEAYLAVKIENSKKLSLLENKFIIIDCASDRCKRNLLAIKFGGFLNDEKYSFTACILEIVNHYAILQVDKIIETLEFYTDIQKDYNWEITKLFNFKQIIYDNTSSNRGKTNGVFAVLNRKRKEAWLNETEEFRKENLFDDLVEKGCDDHTINLSSTEFEKRLVILTENWNMTFLLSKGKRHAANFVVLHLYQRLTGEFRREFRGFLLSKNIKPFKFVRVVETRFSTIEVCSLIIYQYFNYIMLFLQYSFPILTDLDKKVFFALCNIDVLAVIKIRAFKAHFFDLPFMKAINLIRSEKEYVQYLKGCTSQILEVIEKPTLCINNHEIPRQGITLDSEVDKIIQNTSAMHLSKTKENVIQFTGNLANENVPLIEELEEIEEIDELMNICANQEEVDEVEEIEEDLEGGNEIVKLVHEITKEKDLLSSFLSFRAPEKRKESIPNCDERISIYVKEGMKSLMFQLEKQNYKYFNFENAYTLTLVATSREVERLFGQSKALLAKNVNY